MEGVPYSTSYGLAHDLRAMSLDALTQGVVVTDARLPDCPVVYASDAFLRLTGYRRDDVVGRNCRFLQGPGSEDEALAALRVALRDDQPFFGRLLNYRRDGTPFQNALSIVPLHDEDGVTSHHVASQTDVTALREHDLALEQRSRVALLDSFARGLAHDFNNVLLAASGYAELLAGKLAAPEVEQLRRYAEQIVSSCESGRRLTQQLLGISRGGDLAEERVDTVGVVASTIARARGLMPHGLTVRAELPADAPVMVGDRSQLEQVLLSLLVNARDAVDGPGEIVVGLAAGADTIQLTVTDEGGGMPQALRARTFEAVFTTGETGSGLGLLTTTAIVRRLGGSVEVRSTDDGRTTIVVSLPLAPTTI